MKINANDQLDLKGSCLNRCKNLLDHTYKIYALDPELNKWIQFTNSSYFHMTGRQPKSDLIVSKELFADYSTTLIWKFEFLSKTTNQQEIGASNALIFYVNQPPKPGMCDISPTNGTTSTFFTIYCADWSDSDGSVVNYTFYGKIFLLFEFNINKL
jgi:hypothetical protein